MPSSNTNLDLSSIQEMRTSPTPMDTTIVATTLQRNVELPGLAAPSPTTSHFLDLPFELREKIYVYASLVEDTWIGGASEFDSTKSVASHSYVHHSYDLRCQPNIFVKTKSMIVLTNHRARDEYRAAVWRHFMSDRDARQVDIKIHQLDSLKIQHFFARCSPLEVEKLLVRGKCRLRLSLLGLHGQNFYTLARLTRLQQVYDMLGVFPEFNIADGEEDDCIGLAKTLHEKLRWNRLKCNQGLMWEDDWENLFLGAMFRAVEEHWSKLPPFKPLMDAIDAPPEPMRQF